MNETRRKLNLPQAHDALLFSISGFPLMAFSQVSGWADDLASTTALPNDTNQHKNHANIQGYESPASTPALSPIGDNRDRELRS